MRWRHLVSAALLALILFGCNGGPAITNTPATSGISTTATQLPSGAYGLPVIDPLDVSGDIATAGSSTVFPLSEAVAGRFEEEGYLDQITIDSIGTGAGFERFCQAGEIDIANASREINDEEIALCQGIGRGPIGFRVGTDALAVVVSPSNYFAENLTLDRLALVFSTAATWADVDPSFPPHPIARFSPGTDSGTFDYFIEAVYDKDEGPLLAASSVQFSEDDNVLVQGVSGDGCTQSDTTTPCAVGYFGYAYYRANDDRLSLVAIDGVEASAANVDNGSYPLARPLFIYSDATIMAGRPQVASFIAYYLTVVNDVIGDVGYFPAPTSELEGAAQAWLDALGG